MSGQTHSCRWGITHEPQHLSSDGYCAHVESTDPLTGKERRITWNWDTGGWEVEG